MKSSLLALLLLAAPLVAQDAATPATEAPAPAKAAEAAKEELARVAEIEVNLGSSEDPFAANPFGANKLNYLGFLTAVRKAAQDPEIDGVILKLEGYQLGWARLVELRDTLLGAAQGGQEGLPLQGELLRAASTSSSPPPPIASRCPRREWSPCPASRSK